MRGNSILYLKEDIIMSKKNTETTTKEVETVEIEKNEADEVKFELVSEKPSKFKQAGLWAKDHAKQLVIGGITVIGVAAGIVTAAVLKSMVNDTENESDDYHALEDDSYDEETDTCVEVNATENETSEE